MSEQKMPLALAFPLRGSQLIEASAGTGKTFTISALYLRLILGHGGEASGFGRELLPPQILVVTFTDAATKELRDRIRTRLAEAARFFRDEIEAPDALVAQLREQFGPEQWAACAGRLDIAAQWMDEAAVSTIHSWCQRMLREHAFDSGSLFTRPWKPTTATCSARSCVITGGDSATACKAMRWPGSEPIGSAPKHCCHGCARCSAASASRATKKSPRP